MYLASAGKCRGKKKKRERLKFELFRYVILDAIRNQLASRAFCSSSMCRSMGISQLMASQPSGQGGRRERVQTGGRIGGE
jgi:hypothetical protein